MNVRDRSRKQKPPGEPGGVSLQILRTEKNPRADATRLATTILMHERFELRKHP
jgi:hypothetical protein